MQKTPEYPGIVTIRGFPFLAKPEVFEERAFCLCVCAFTPAAEGSAAFG
jgi:hypothetical protein